MTDIIDRLTAIANNEFGNYHGTEAPSVAQEAINEIKRLRALVGAASEGPSFRNVRDTIQPNKMPE